MVDAAQIEGKDDLRSTVEIENVTHRYRNSMALKDISLNIKPGEVLGVIGPDGVGKSTLLSLIAGVRRLQKGRILVLGSDLALPAQRRAVCAHIAYMPQGLGQNLYPSLSVLENLDFFARLFGQRGLDRQSRVEVLLEATGLASFSDRPVGKLSGGMKQKLGLCAALIHNPDVLILDEPTTGVDPLSRRRFWDLIKDVRRRRPRMSVLVATAYMDEAEPFDRLVAIHDGCILAVGAPKELKTRTDADGLDQAFIRLLPEHRRGPSTRFEKRMRSPKTGPFAIEAIGLGRRFGDFTAVDDVGFAILKGEIFGFVGSNGCGKTTTMKMLTGLLEPTTGEVRLFGQPLHASNRSFRNHVGYMSQSFSLYGELSVHQNLDLHARLYGVPGRDRDARIQQLITDFDLEALKDERSDLLPLGHRQRLSLAVAIIHKPQILILDEPTSGVDPIGRDAFWQRILQLSRDEGVTIFVSTHYMNEAERCDRVSLMHKGRVLAVGTPSELVQLRNSETLEEAFVAYLRSEPGAVPDVLRRAPLDADDAWASNQVRKQSAFEPRRLWAFAMRETAELVRDRIRLAFTLLGPLILMIVFSYGISFDVERVRFAVFDRDRTPESRELAYTLSASRYFRQRPHLSSSDEITRRLRSGELVVAIEIPPGFGKDLAHRDGGEIGVWLDGAVPFRAETAKGYVVGAINHSLTRRRTNEVGGAPPVQPLKIEPRFRYNQAFKSVYAIAPGTIMLLLMMIPAMMTAVGVVREKELGSITNFYGTPVTRLEFLLGKQIPYVALSALSFLSLVALSVVLFGVPIKGSAATLALGSLAYMMAATGFGLFISTFVRTQIAAIFGVAIITVILSINFSGFFRPVSTLVGLPKLMATIFPPGYFQRLIIGTFTKGLGMVELWRYHLVLLTFALIFFVLALLLLRRQER